MKALTIVLLSGLLLCTGGLSFATMTTVDFTETLDFFVIDYNDIPDPVRVDLYNPAHAFNIAGITFVDVLLDTANPYSSDGHVINGAGAGQHGSFTLYWDSPINFITLDLAGIFPGINLLADIHTYKNGVLNYYANIHDIVEYFPSGRGRITLDIDEGFDAIGTEWWQWNNPALDAVSYRLVPEPAIILLLGGGLLGLGAFRERLRKK